jgi:peptide/nickel transport system permease protein
VRTYIIRRLALLIPSLIIVTILVSLIIRLLPGKAIDVLLAQQGFTVAADRAKLEAELGLDQPWPQQYLTWVGGIVRGDLGESLRSRRDITGELKVRLPITLELAAIAFVFALVIAIPIGVFSAVKQDSVLDYVARSLAIGAVALPGFWLATLIVVWPSVWWGWSPPVTYTRFQDDPIENLSKIWLPALLLALYLVGYLMRMTRAMMLEVLRSDYIRTARAKGLGGLTVVNRHALRNALVAVVTVIGLQIPVLIGGAVVYETVFSIPGVGRYMLDAAANRDYPVIQGINLVLATVVLLVNLVVDITYTRLDPRIRLAGGS